MPQAYVHVQDILAGWFADCLVIKETIFVAFAFGRGIAGMNGIVSMLTQQLKCTDRQRRKQLERE